MTELAKASKQIRAYEKIIAKMTKISSSIVSISNVNVHHNDFKLEDMAGRIVVIHNADIGDWFPNSSSKFNPHDSIFIDERGNLTGFVPKNEPVLVSFKKQGEFEHRVFDALTGEEYFPNKNGAYSVEIDPGSGTMIYMGSLEGMKQLKLTLR